MKHAKVTVENIKTGERTLLIIECRPQDNTSKIKKLVKQLSPGSRIVKLTMVR